jgi:hypothetical protein
LRGACANIRFDSAPAEDRLVLEMEPVRLAGGRAGSRVSRRAEVVLRTAEHSRTCTGATLHSFVFDFTCRKESDPPVSLLIERVEK